MTAGEHLRAAYFAGKFLLLFVLGATVALADIATLTIGVPNGAASCCTAPYATVQIDRINGTKATITFTSDTNAGFLYLMGARGAADLNVNGAYSLGAVTESNSISGFTATYKHNKPGEVSKFGKFNLSLDNFGQFTDSATRISFTITNTSGIWTSASDVLAADNKGYEAAIHVFVCAAACSTSEGALTTGFTANDTPSAAPEPAAVILLSSSLIGLGAIWRRRRNRRVTQA